MRLTHWQARESIWSKKAWDYCANGSVGAGALPGCWPGG